MPRRLLSASILSVVTLGAAAVVGGAPTQAASGQLPVGLVLAWGAGYESAGVYGGGVAIVTLPDWHVHWLSHGITAKAVDVDGVWYFAKPHKLVVTVDGSWSRLMAFDLRSGEERVWYDKIEAKAVEGYQCESYLVPGDEDGVYMRLAPLDEKGQPVYECLFAGNCIFARLDLRTWEWRKLSEKPAVCSRLAAAENGPWPSSPRLFLNAAAEALANGRKVPNQEEFVKSLHAQIAPKLVEKGIIRQDARMTEETGGARVLSSAQILKDTILQIDGLCVVCRARGSLTVVTEDAGDFKVVSSSPPTFAAKEPYLLAPHGVAVIYDPSALDHVKGLVKLHR